MCFFSGKQGPGQIPWMDVYFYYGNRIRTWFCTRQYVAYLSFM